MIRDPKSVKRIEKIAYSIVFLGAVIVAASLYSGHQKEKRLRIINPKQPATGPQYFVTLQSINYDDRTIQTNIRTSELKSRREVTVYFDFSYRFAGSGSTTLSGGPERVVLKPPNNDLQNASASPGQSDYVNYETDLKIRFNTDMHRFPFDDIQMAIAVETLPEFSPGESVERAVPVLYMIESFVPDYAIAEGDVRFVDERLQPAYVTLKRDDSVIQLALLIGIIGLVSSWMLIKKARKERVELALLSYFGGLWAARSIVFTPLKGNVPFPTYVDLAVVFLFCLTVFGIWASSLFKLRDEELVKNDPGQNY